ncbi:hypothetical protein [Actinoallomurus sp. CA-150999]|uniref:hypothetical protein n=1 Tax=Actinoallomurus sp. CA-150999 TaxID=3239887 RepID=UPI003D8B8C4C
MLPVMTSERIVIVVLSMLASEASARMTGSGFVIVVIEVMAAPMTPEFFIVLVVPAYPIDI